MDAIAYIDGFNLYHGALKQSGLKWLNLHALACALLRGHTVTTVKYFTARVDDRPDDPHQSQRQDVFLRALATVPQVEVHYGQFRTRTKRVRLANPPPGQPFVDARITEEKGTDVALGAHLVRDAFRRNDDAVHAALVISNDSDLQVPITMAMEAGIKVVTVNPHLHHGQDNHLFGSDVRRLRVRHLQKAQFPHQILDARGRLIVCPEQWQP